MQKIFKKSHSAEKKSKGGPFGLVRYCMLRGKHFGSVPWANRYNLATLVWYNTLVRQFATTLEMQI